MKRYLIRLTRRSALSCLVAGVCASFGTAIAQQPTAKGPTLDVLRGRYLVQVVGRNDCHTQGYPEAGGKVDEKLWLSGSTLGWRGPWGTTYAVNLRLVAGI